MPANPALSPRAEPTLGIAFGLSLWGLCLGGPESGSLTLGITEARSAEHRNVLWAENMVGWEGSQQWPKVDTNMVSGCKHDLGSGSRGFGNTINMQVPEAGADHTCSATYQT